MSLVPQVLKDLLDPWDPQEQREPLVLLDLSVFPELLDQLDHAEEKDPLELQV